MAVKKSSSRGAKKSGYKGTKKAARKSTKKITAKRHKKIGKKAVGKATKRVVLKKAMKKAAWGSGGSVRPRAISFTKGHTKKASVFRKKVGKVISSLKPNYFQYEIINFVNNANPKTVSNLFGMLLLKQVDLSVFKEKDAQEIEELAEDSFNDLSMEDKLLARQEVDNFINHVKPLKINWCDFFDFCTILDFSTIAKGIKEVAFKKIKRVFGQFDGLVDPIVKCSKVKAAIDIFLNYKNLLAALTANPHLTMMLLAFIIATRLGWEACECDAKKRA